MINAEAIAKMKDGVIVLNFARDLLVDDDAWRRRWLRQGRRYVTDFPNGKTANMPGCIAIPHLALPRRNPRTTAPKWPCRS